MDIREICDIILKLNLYSDSTKIIHYTTNMINIHELCDSIQSSIDEFTDELAEQLFGYIGNPKMSDFKDITKIEINKSNTIEDLIDNVENLIEPLKTFCNKNNKLSNIVSLIDDFNGKLYKFKFLSTFDKISNYKR